MPDGAKWQEENETEGLGVFAAAKRTGRYKFWEPFYVGTNEEPLFDERLTWEGQSNKMAQVRNLIFEMLLDCLCMRCDDYLLFLITSG